MTDGGRRSNSFEAAGTIRAGRKDFRVFLLPALEKRGVGRPSRLPFCLRVLLENLLRHEDGSRVTASDVEALASWKPGAGGGAELQFFPARIILQDFTGVPVLADLAAMRDAAAGLGADPRAVNPLIPVDLVIDHSVQADVAGAADALARNLALEFGRNRERYAFLRWGQRAFSGLRVVPPGTGIIHQVNLEHLATVVAAGKDGLAFPDTVLGTDSHTTMINGAGVMGWGVGGIEAEAAMLGEPVSLSLPEVVGVRLAGRLPPGATAHDAVLTVTQVLRRKGVVGRFVEFFGEGAAALPLADRATIANMAPEYGATTGFFPVDAETLHYLKATGRPAGLVTLVEAYCRAQSLLREPGSPDPGYSEVVEIDLARVEPCVAGPRRPQDRVPLPALKAGFRRALTSSPKENGFGATAPGGRASGLGHGTVAIASITSCTSTSNPGALVAAGLLARNAVARGLRVPPHVKTTFSPGSRAAAGLLAAAGLMPGLESLGFHVTGYGCMTCIGNSGPLRDAVARAVREEGLVAAAVLSGNRNFEGRINPLVRAAYLASPPLVVAFALAGTVDIDLAADALGTGKDGKPVFLSDLWPKAEEVAGLVAKSVEPGLFKKVYKDAMTGGPEWRAFPAPAGDRFAWEPGSTYIRRPPFLDGAGVRPAAPAPIRGARALLVLGDSVTTDHISPAGAIPADGPAGRFLAAAGIPAAEFNSFGARRGNHEVMVRGAFAGGRLRNLLVPGTEGGVTLHLPSGKRMSVFEAAEEYRKAGIPLVVLAGRDYGAGSSRDWAAKGPLMLGVRAVLAASFERIHRSNLVEMGILPLQFPDGKDREKLGLDGTESFDIEVPAGGPGPRASVVVRASRAGSGAVEFKALARIDTPSEAEYLRHGGILPLVLRRICGAV